MTKFSAGKSVKKDKLITLPSPLMDALVADAERCKRSVTKQIEAILASYFEIGNSDVDARGIRNAQVNNNYQSKQNFVAREKTPKRNNLFEDVDLSQSCKKEEILSETSDEERDRMQELREQQEWED